MPVVEDAASGGGERGVGEAFHAGAKGDTAECAIWYYSRVSDCYSIQWSAQNHSNKSADDRHHEDPYVQQQHQPKAPIPSHFPAAEACASSADY